MDDYTSMVIEATSLDKAMDLRLFWAGDGRAGVRIIIRTKPDLTTRTIVLEWPPEFIGDDIKRQDPTIYEAALSRDIRHPEHAVMLGFLEALKAHPDFMMWLMLGVWRSKRELTESRKQGVGELNKWAGKEDLAKLLARPEKWLREEVIKNLGKKAQERRPEETLGQKGLKLIARFRR